MTIALLYIGIGKYSCFWDDFYKTCEENFIPEAKKHYFFVTDKPIEVGANVTIIPQDDLGWPCNAMLRYMFFLRKKEELKKFDYIFFCNGNTRFKKMITPEEILPTKEDGGLLALTWKSMNANPDTFGFERREESAAFIPFGTQQMYYQSGFLGGSGEKFIQLMEACQEMTMIDFQNGIVPIWHDESILNRYMLGRKCKVVGKQYGMPEEWSRGEEVKILFFKKDKVLGHSYLRKFKGRSHTNTWLRKLLRKLKLIS